MHRQEVVERLAGGHFIDLLVSNLERVTEEVLTTGNTGTVSVTLKISTPDKQAVDPLATVDHFDQGVAAEEGPGDYGFLLSRRGVPAASIGSAGIPRANL